MVKEKTAEELGGEWAHGRPAWHHEGQPEGAGPPGETSLCVPAFLSLADPKVRV